MKGLCLSPRRWGCERVLYSRSPHSPFPMQGPELGNRGQDCPWGRTTPLGPSQGVLKTQCGNNTDSGGRSPHSDSGGQGEDGGLSRDLCLRHLLLIMWTWGTTAHTWESESKFGSAKDTEKASGRLRGLMGNRRTYPTAHAPNETAALA